MKRILFVIISLLVYVSLARAKDSDCDYPVRPVPFSDVRITEGFWLPRMETNRVVTVPYAFKKCEETGRISNFENAGKQEGKFKGIYFNDSDLYKVIEGAAYSLMIHPDPELEKYVDGVIDKIASAQWEDGYLYTFYSLPKRQPGKRWTNESSMHELYCAGHFFEGAVAYYQVTGKKKILDVATRLADKIDSVYGPEDSRDPPGHQEIEIGLARLYRQTGEKKYLDLAKFFLDCRGRIEGREKLQGPYSQDHKPVVEQDEAVGHAVRACYMYAGMADIAALTGDSSYIGAIDRIWENVAGKKVYITGGVGSTRRGEAFGKNYELPNASAYNETCAAIANAMWNHRLFLLHGDGKYMDMVERIIYNGFLSGIAMTGDLFFYPNPLESQGHRRSAWFGCSCCPVNIVRFVPSIPGYAYAHDGDRLYVSLFINGTATVKMDKRTVKLTQETGYPWDGNISIKVEPDKKDKFSIRIRVPGWTRNEPMPGGLYRYMEKRDGDVILKVNGKKTEIELEKGFAVISRKWEKGDAITLEMPMPIRRVICDENVDANRGRVALVRGPIVYCAEKLDNVESPSQIVLGDDVKFSSEHRLDLLNGVTVLTGVLAGGDKFMAIPYYSWAHRDKTEMNVWFVRAQKALEETDR